MPIIPANLAIPHIGQIPLRLKQPISYELLDALPVEDIGKALNPARKIRYRCSYDSSHLTSLVGRIRDQSIIDGLNFGIS